MPLTPSGTYPYLAPVLVVLGMAGCGDNDRLAFAPDTVIDTPPATLSSVAHVAVAFHAAGEAVGFLCRVDGAAQAMCVSPWTFDVLDGAHRLEIAAIGADHTVGEPATASFAVDTAAPRVTIETPVIPPRTSNQQPVVFFTVSDASGVTTACQIDADPAVGCDGSFEAPNNLPEGSHSYRVMATDAAGNAGVVAVSFDIDVTPPAVTIAVGPIDPTNDDTPSFVFTTSPDTTRTRCEIDTGEVIDPCTTGVTFPPIAPGARTFTVTAFDDAVPPNTASASYPFVLGVCGDDVAQGTEPCDGTDLRGQSCVGLGFFAGTLGCTASCSYDTMRCTGCGNGIVEPGEQCDGTQLGGATCASLGFDSGALACSGSCTFDTQGCGKCGNGVKDGAELCDGSDVGSATCDSLGHAPGTLGCAAGCNGYDTTGCDGGFVAAGTGFTGRVCFDGVRFGQPGLVAPSVVACTEDNGALRTLLGGPVAWASIDGATAGSMITNLHGRAIVPQPDGPATVYLSDGSTAQNGFRTNNFTSWTLVPFADAGTAVEVFAAAPGSSTSNIIGGWDATRGAVVLHGGFAATAVVSAVDPTGSVTGTVRSLAKGATNDIYAVVHGQTPAGDPATGGGIYLTCDQVGIAGGTYVERDTGIAAGDRPLVWSITVDPSSFTSTMRMCGASMFTGYATTYYVALRGGGQVYKTGDGGMTWTRSNTGLPGGAEVYKIAIDCFSAASPQRCVDSTLLYAATSAGLYRSTDAGAHWTLAGLEGKVVRGVALEPEHATGTAPQIFVGVDDAVGIYRRP